MNITAPDCQGAALVSQEQQREEMANFSFRSVVRSKLNLSYFPQHAGKYTTNCINITVLPGGGAIVLSFYTDTGYPKGWRQIPGCGEGELIEGLDHRHLAKIHKRLNSWKSHYHVSVKPEHCDAFLHRVLAIIAISPDDQSHLKRATQYLRDNPHEPGLAFKDGSYAENGGARSMYDPQRNLTHINGPLKLIELNALPDQDET